MGTYHRNASKLTRLIIATTTTPHRPTTPTLCFHYPPSTIDFLPSSRSYTTRQSILLNPNLIPRIPKKARTRYTRSKIEPYIIEEWIPALPPNGLGINKLWDDIKLYKPNAPKKWLSGEVVKAICGELARRGLVELWRRKCDGGKIKLMPPGKGAEEVLSMERDRLAKLEEREIVDGKEYGCLTSVEQRLILGSWKKKDFGGRG
mmetsp:Transcript_15152/g.32661  ORF Transcript_15152/g.32661 Transcript_15152/m.32661 type:complete len:204 (+) Transcript_15152:198-809(+)